MNKIHRSGHPSTDGTATSTQPLPSQINMRVSKVAKETPLVLVQGIPNYNGLTDEMHEKKILSSFAKCTSLILFLPAAILAASCPPIGIPAATLFGVLALLSQLAETYYQRQEDFYMELSPEHSNNSLEFALPIHVL